MNLSQIDNTLNKSMKLSIDYVVKLIVYFPFNYQFLFSVIIHKWAEEAPILLYWRTFIMNRGGGVLMHIAS